MIMQAATVPQSSAFQNGNSEARAGMIQPLHDLDLAVEALQNLTQRHFEAKDFELGPRLYRGLKDAVWTFLEAWGGLSKSAIYWGVQDVLSELIVQAVVRHCPGQVSRFRALGVLHLGPWSLGNRQGTEEDSRGL